MKPFEVMDAMIIRDGTSQRQRAQPALQQHYFDVDEMSFAHLMDMAVEYARSVKFYKLSNQPDGSWENYFSADETVVIAAILSTDLAVLRRDFDYLLQQVGGNEPLLRASLQAERLPTFQLAKKLDAWFLILALAQSEIGNSLRMLIGSVIGTLNVEMQMLKNFYAQPAEKKTAVEEVFQRNFSPIWFRTEQGDENQAQSDDEKTTLLFSLRLNFSSFLKAVEIVQEGAAQRLPATLINKNHDPAVALLIAFVQLYHRVQRKANQFTERHLDFYYDEVLRAKPRGFVKDSAYLVMQPSVAGTEVRIAKGTPFLAPVSNKGRPDIIYTGDDDLSVNDAVVRSLYTLYFERNRLNSPENKMLEAGLAGTRQIPTGGWLASLPIVSLDNATDEEKLRRHPLLGAPKCDAEMADVDNARIGFAVASRVLLLGEGTRTINLTLKFGAGATGEGASLQSRIKTLAEVLETTELDAFYKAFRHMFTITLTTAKGWFEIAEYIPNFEQGKNTLSITVFLPAEVVAIVSYDAKIHGENFETSLPVMRCALNQFGYLYPYGILKDLLLKEVTIDARVQGCRNLALYNNVGQLTSAAPFNPFGPIPRIDSYMIVGSAEAAGKQLTSFELDIEWGSLPSEAGAWDAYYEGYRDAPEISEVAVKITTLVDGKWLPRSVPEQSTEFLFDTMPDRSMLSGLNAHRILPAGQAIKFSKPLSNFVDPSEFVYMPGCRGGFFKFTLSTSEFVFGHKDYPNDLAYALTYNAKQKKARSLKAVPNVPYTPLINAIALNYSATSTINMEHVETSAPGVPQEKLFHLHPLGWEDLGTTKDGSAVLIPHYDFSGNLFVGFEAEKNIGMLTLFFHLSENSLPIGGGAGDASTVLLWHYLADNRWIPLPENFIVSDTTYGFLTSGIVTLKLPDNIGKNNTILPAGSYWLRIAGENDIEKVCDVYAVYTQALKVTRQSIGPLSNDGPVVIPASTIKRSQKTIPGLGKVIQVIDSFGGRAAENSHQMRTRIGERLKHKNRAVTAGDYERLILEQFPEIYKVKCFANMVMDADLDKIISPGHVLIVALPHAASDSVPHQVPTLNGFLINQIKEFVKERAAASAIIDVKNPAYEKIQVRCTVKFKKGCTGGRYINLLNQALSDFLSPWKEIGYTAHFGWSVRQHDIESFILDRDYIDAVTNFSMLRISARDQQQFNLFDTAVPNGLASAPGAGLNQDIYPLYPWSIAIPMKKHFIETVDHFDLIKALPTGINELEIGSTFIISPKANHGQEK